MNRWQLQQIARIRKKEAKKLLDNDFYCGAYYLCGYVVECAIKACIAKKTMKYDFPDKDIVKDSYIHKLEKLITIAGLNSELDQEKKSNVMFRIYWANIIKWNEESRYTVHSEEDATTIYKSLVARNNGVYRWVRKYW